jgi:glycine/sarcosine N-methyltransferase
VTANVAAFYDDFAEDYADAILSDFDEVSRRQGERLNALLRPRGVQRVLDVACGSGLQSLALAQLGYRVTGLDISEGMIAQAKRNAQRRRVAANWVVGDWHDLRRLFPRPFDAVICWGNSLSHVSDAEDLAAVLSEMAAVTRAGGVCLVDLRDWDRVMQERPKGSVRQVKQTAAGRMISFDVWHYPSADMLVMEIFVLREREAHWTVRRREVVHCVIRRVEFEAAVARAGFATAKLAEPGGFNTWVLEREG